MSIRYSERLMDVGAAASVGSVADSYDNAMAEALNGTFKAELIEHQGPWRDADQVERAVVQWVGWYNTERLHSALERATGLSCERSSQTLRLNSRAGCCVLIWTSGLLCTTSELLEPTGEWYGIKAPVTQMTQKGRMSARLED